MVGILKPTHTANDRVLFVPIVSLFAIEEHSYGLIEQAMIRKGIDPHDRPEGGAAGRAEGTRLQPRRPAAVGDEEACTCAPTTGPTSRTRDRPGASRPVAGGESLSETPKTPPPAKADAAGGDDEDVDAYHLDKDGNIIPDLPRDEWEISAVLVRTRGPYPTQHTALPLRVATPEAMAVNPAVGDAGLLRHFLGTSTLVLLVLAGLVSVVAAVSILVSIYNSVSARQTRDRHPARPWARPAAKSWR